MAQFVPDPDVFDLEEFIEQLGWQLGELYGAAEDELVEELARRAYRDLELQGMLPTAPAGRGLTVAQRREQNRILALIAQHRAQSVRELRTLAAELAERLREADLAEQIVRLAAIQGEAAAAAQLGFAKNLPRLSPLTGTATQAVAALALSLQSRLEVMNDRITRYAPDAFQRVTSLTAPGTLLGATTSRVQQQRAVQRFLHDGIPGFVDKSGRRWRIGSYAEMAGRTAVNRAFNDAAIWRMQQSGINLVTIVGGLDACSKCAPWIGKILSSDGSPAGPRILPHAAKEGTTTVIVHGTLAQARAAGWNHPNCRDRVVSYLPGLTTPQSDFEYNPEAEAERAEQRKLERDIRAAKRDVATAPDAVTRRRAEREVREAQATMRDFTDRTGRARQSYREQLHFADGKGGPLRPNARPTVPTSPRGGVDVRIPKTTPIGRDVAAARASIAKVHSIPTRLPNLPVTTARLDPGVNGVYRGGRGILQMSANGPSPRLTFAHEIGHYLDHQLLGTATTNFETRMLTDPLTQRWLDAANATPSVRALRALLTDPALPADIVEHVTYLLQPVELWGRSYAQFIALRSADEIMAAELAAYRASTAPWTSARQWDTTEFEDVAASIEAILRSKGVWR